MSEDNELDIEIERLEAKAASHSDIIARKIWDLRLETLEKYPTEEAYNVYLLEKLATEGIDVGFGITHTLTQVQFNALMEQYRFLARIKDSTDDAIYEAYVPDDMKEMALHQVLEEALRLKDGIEQQLLSVDVSRRKVILEQVYKPLQEFISTLKATIDAKNLAWALAFIANWKRHGHVNEPPSLDKLYTPLETRQKIPAKKATDKQVIIDTSSEKIIITVMRKDK
jgi:hypothetical protein